MLITTFNQLLKKSHHSQRYNGLSQEDNQLTLFQSAHTFFSLDIKSVYTNILNVEGMKYVKTSLEIYSKRSASINMITKFLLLILTQKNFIFNCKNYSHIKRSLMGTICTLSQTNILMEHFEGKFIYSLIKIFLLIYLRFIDEILFMWTGSKKDLENLLNKLNADRPLIKFKC